MKKKPHEYHEHTHINVFEDGRSATTFIMRIFYFIVLLTVFVSAIGKLGYVTTAHIVDHDSVYYNCLNACKEEDMDVDMWCGSITNKEIKYNPYDQGACIQSCNAMLLTLQGIGGEE